VAANFIIKGFTNPTAGRRCRKKRPVGKSGLSEKAGCLTPHAGLSETAGLKQQRQRERERYLTKTQYQTMNYQKYMINNK
jgi:hypothetical protein